MNIFTQQVIDPILRSLEIYKDKTAFFINEDRYSYEHLGQSVSKIRLEISRNTCGQAIGLVANDDIETYASIIAIWLEGKAYVSLHPKQPIDRCLEIINQVGIDLILDSSEKTRYEGFNVIMSSKLTFREYLLNYQNEASQESLAYILFTSGSTGKPKGVQLSRENIGAFMESFWKSGIKITSEDRCLQCFDLTFDVSVQSYLVPLTKGASCFTVPHDQIKYSYVYGLMDEHELTFGAMAPSMIRYLKPYFDEIDIPSMRYCILTAEASPLSLVEQWSKCLPNAVIYDFYGPTEGTIYCTYYVYKRDGENNALNGMLSIGKAMEGVGTILIDQNSNILSNDQKGELCISGSQITPGYWQNPEKDAEVFIHKRIDGVDTRFYKTGDLCYFDTGGNIMLFGRKDHQVKIQGYRIELGEIEFHCREYLKNFNAVAIPFTNGSGNTEIALFIESQQFDLKAMVEYLHSKMPSYMVPTKYCFEPQFPINNSDKVDRVKLKTKLDEQFSN